MNFLSLKADVYLARLVCTWLLKNLIGHEVIMYLYVSTSKVINSYSCEMKLITQILQLILWMDMVCQKTGLVRIFQPAH